MRLELCLLIIASTASLPGSTSCEDGFLSGLDCLASKIHNSWVEQLSPDPDQEPHAPNKLAREVHSGHYVRVLPTPLPEPYLVAYSPEAASMLSLSGADARTDRFARLFSGDAGAVGGFGGSWATPYALSIYGEAQMPNGAGPTGNGYGDGRAISLAEVVVNGTGRWELQLKGSGTTPFCRGADGRAVLRSSVREFLVSEAMHHLGVPTTRALSLVASGTERVARPWYSQAQARERGAALVLGASDDDDTVRKHGGDIMQEEACAMTTRVAPSFLRVGHFELFGRRARDGDKVGLQQLEQLARHALFREYPHHADPEAPLQKQLLGMLSEASGRFAHLAAEWIRVGYVQSNFNADNCLISGRTMDYGPFGFVEKFDPSWGMWIHAGQHFSFMNQPKAAGQNFKMFAESLRPLMDEQGQAEIQSIIDGYQERSQESMHAMWARKLGLQAMSQDGLALLGDLGSLLNRHGTDWTIFWRQLSELPPLLMGPVASDEVDIELGAEVLERLAPAFYAEPPEELRADWAAWLRRWLALLKQDGRPLETVAEGMRLASPRYVPREAILVEAYTAAQAGDHGAVHDLQELFRRPYDEQPFFGERYYRRRGRDEERQGGVGFMS